MTQVTRESLKAKLAAVFTTQTEGAEQISFSVNALAQMNAIVERMKEESHFDESQITQDDLNVADQIINHFTPKAITGQVENGVLLPISDAEYLEAINTIKQEGELMEFFVVLPVVLVAEVANEVKAFYR